MEGNGDDVCSDAVADAAHAISISRSVGEPPQNDESQTRQWPTRAPEVGGVWLTGPLAVEAVPTDLTCCPTCGRWHNTGFRQCYGCRASSTDWQIEHWQNATTNTPPGPPSPEPQPEPQREPTIAPDKPFAQLLANIQHTHPNATPQQVRLAREDFFALRKKIGKARCRRVVPPWAVLAEAWRILLCKSLFLSGERRGIGYDTHMHRLWYMHRIMAQVMLKMRVDNRAPRLWHRSRVFSLYKKSLEDVSEPYDAQRAVHGLCPVGKGVYAHMFDQSRPPPTATV